jgi:hypothetical protein
MLGGYVPYLDHLLSEVNNRFADVRSTVASLSCILPHQLHILSEDNALSLLQTYEGDLNYLVKDVFLLEIERWKAKWKDYVKEDCPSDAISTLSACPKEFYPCINTTLQILATIPVTSATAERFFSTVRRLKYYLRQNMGTSSLNGLAHLSINEDISVVPDEILDILAKRKRRLDIVL